MSKDQPPRSTLDGFGAVDAATIKSIVAAASDIAILAGPDGRIEDVYAEPSILPDETARRWRGRRVGELVTVDSRDKVDELIADAASGAAPRWREINHVGGPDGEFPVRYSAVSTGDDGRVVLIGRDLRPISQIQSRLVQAQLTMEQDYERIRQIETRYRVLFETAEEALLIVSADTGRVIDANSAAARLLGREAGDLVGRSFANRLAPASREPFAEAIGKLRQNGRSHSLQVKAKAEDAALGLEILLFRSLDETLCLCRLTTQYAAGPDTDDVAHALGALFARTSDALVFTDASGQIQHANAAFLALANIAAGETIRNATLSDYLGRPEIDLKVMTTNARAKGRFSVYATTLRSAFSVVVPVEISTTFLKEGDREGFGFVLRNVSRAAPARGSGTAVSAEAVEHIIELVGSTPLKELVRGTSDVVEKLCIETAIRLTNNNRASAAEMLGLSRQSLYVKLRKYGLIARNGES